jgi:hypothetical protein
VREQSDNHGRLSRTSDVELVYEMDCEANAGFYGQLLLETQNSDLTRTGKRSRNPNGVSGVSGSLIHALTLRIAGLRRGDSTGPADGSHLPAALSSAEKSLTAVGLEP